MTDLYSVRARIYAHFVATGRAPDHIDAAAIGELAAQKLIALAPNSDTIWMAHPFSAFPTAFRVASGGVEYYANCAWDAFGIAAVLERDTECHARCAHSGEMLDLSVEQGRARGAGVVHIAVPPRRFWENVGYT